MLANPIEQGPLEPYVIAKTFRFQPFVAEDFLSFGEEFLVETRLFYKLPG
jgi:hypothetical protein